MSDFAKFTDLYCPDFNEASDSEIFDGLKVAGIDTTLEEFIEEAREAGNPTDLTDKWFEKYNLQDDFDFPLYDAIFELWKRHLKDVKCPEALVDELDDIIDSYNGKGDILDHEDLLQAYNQLKDYYHKFIKEDGTPDTDLFSELYAYAYNDIEGFLIQMPFDLEHKGLIDEAVNIGRWFSRLSSMPQYYMKDIAYILAKAGRREEALRQIDENMENFPDDFWTVINAGDAMLLLGEEEKAERFFLEGCERDAEKWDKVAAFDRIVDFYSERGNAEKASWWKKRRKSLVYDKK